ncbi:MAG: MATE family efflux transporter [Gammaproteobacteria bacterium]|nr:MATE family efflux transporter [Gammaproteobacteria bacterium]
MRKEDYITLGKNSTPLIMRGFVMALQLSTKRAILGNKDGNMLADYSYIAALEGLIFLLVYGSFTIINAKISQAHAQIEAEQKEGRKTDPTKIGALYQQGVMLGLCLMLPTGLIAALAPAGFRLLDLPSSVVEESKTYFIYGFASYFFDMLYRTQTRAMMGLSKPSFSLAGDSGEAVLDVAFTYLFVNGALGFPEMGVSGAAIAYAIAAALTALASFIYLNYFSPTLNQYALYEKNHPLNFADVLKMMSSGLHIGFSWAIEAITLVLLTYYCKFSGPAAQIGIQVAASYSYFLNFCVSGLAEAASIMVGNYIGHDPNRARIVGDRAFQMNIALSSLCFVGVCLNANDVARLFLNSDNPHEIEKIASFLRFQGAIEILSSVRNTGLNVLPSCNDTQYSFILTVAFLLVLNSVIATISQFALGEAADITYGTQLVGYALAAGGTLHRWRKQTDKIQLAHSIYQLKESPRITTEEMLPCEL